MQRQHNLRDSPPAVSASNSRSRELPFARALPSSSRARSRSVSPAAKSSQLRPSRSSTGAPSSSLPRLFISVMRIAASSVSSIDSCNSK
jgi:hypothetical protein